MYSAARKPEAILLLLVGMAWPLGAHWIALHRLMPYFLEHRTAFIPYAVAVAILPSWGLLYSGGILLVRDKAPFPMNAAIALAIAAACFGLDLILFYGAFLSSGRLPAF